MISVLYVDDEKPLLDIGKKFLERIGGFQVTTLNSAIIALDLLKSRQFDAIISDYQMPDLNGIEFLKEVRINHGQIPFILFTGRGREEVVILALNSGADFYLQKGGDPRSQFAELAHKIRSAVQRRDTENALILSERRYRDVVETQTEFICRFTPDWTQVFVNEAYCRYFEMSREEIIGHRFFPQVPQEDKDLIKVHFASLTKDHPVAEMEHRIIMPNGSIRWNWWNNRAFFDDTGAILEYQSVGKDITEQKKAEAALRESEEKFRVLADTAPAAIAVFQGNHDVYVNDYTSNLTGYSKDELYAMNFWDLIHPDSRELIKDRGISRQNGAAAPNRYEIQYLTRDGEIRWADLSVDIIRYEEKPAGIAMLVDITERKRTEEELQAANEELTAAQEELRAQLVELKDQQIRLFESEQNFRTIIDNIQDVYYRTDIHGNLIFASPSLATVLGYSTLEELYGKNLANSLYLNPEKRRDLLEEIERAGSVTNYEVIIKKADGTPVYILTSSHAYYTEAGVYAGVEGIFRDISERKKMELALRESENLYRTIFDNTGAATIIIGPDTTILLANTRWEKLTGTPKDEQVKMMSWTKFIVAEDIERMKQYHYDRRKNPSIVPKVYECRVIDVNNSIHNCITYVDIIPGTQNSVASLIDVTSLKEAENALRESEEKYRMIIENMQDPFYRTDSEGRVLMINPAFIKEFGYQNHDDIIGKKISEMVIFDHVDGADGISSLSSSGEMKEFRLTLKRRDGNSIVFSVANHQIYDNDGTPAGVEGILHDITDHLIVEDALSEVKLKYHELSELLPQMVFEMDPDYQITYANRYTLETMGYSPQDLTGGFSIHKMIDPSQHSEIFNTIDLQTRGNPSVNHEYLGIRKDGSYIPVLLYTTPVYKDQQISGYCGVIVDISVQKEMEKSLKDSEKLFREVFHNANDEIILHEISPDTGPGQFILVNDITCERLGYSRDELMRMSIKDIIPPEFARRTSDISKKLFTDGDIIFESAHRRKDGSVYPIEVNAHLFKLGGADVTLSISRDITEWKQAEEALKQANKKLNILSSITRHDLLNQLNALQIFLDLSRNRVIDDPVSLEYIEKELEIAEIMHHQIGFTKSYQDIGVEEPEWNEVENLIRLAEKQLMITGISLNIAVSGLQIYADRLVEKVFMNLVDNSVRHGKHVSRITISFRYLGNVVVIEYEDNGTGVPDENKELIFSKGFGSNTGWGMFLSREILSITGITIRETGIPGTCARFEIMVPERAYRFLS